VTAPRDPFAGHTPGPWQVAGPAPSLGPVIHYMIANAEGDPLAFERNCYESKLSTRQAVTRKRADGTAIKTKERAYANARLMAAAPDLLRERDKARAEALRLSNEALEAECIARRQIAELLSDAGKAAGFAEGIRSALAGEPDSLAFIPDDGSEPERAAILSLRARVAQLEAVARDIIEVAADPAYHNAFLLGQIATRAKAALATAAPTKTATATQENN